MEGEPRKLIEAMKQLNLLQKRMTDNAQRLTMYASTLSTEKPTYFDSEQEQRKAVAGLVQANMDLVREFLDTKMAIERTNQATIVEFDGRRYSIAELLVLRRNLKTSILGTYHALNEQYGREKLKQFVRVQGDPVPNIVLFYDEQGKNEAIRQWEDLFNAIESRLEIVNATTDLL